MSFADLARSFGVPETSVRRHFKQGHARKVKTTPAPAPPAKPAPVSLVALGFPSEDPDLSFAEVRELAKLIPAPLSMIVFALECADVGIRTTTDDEEDEYLECLDAAEAIVATMPWHPHNQPR